MGSKRAASLKVSTALMPQSSASSLILDLGVDLGIILIGIGAIVSIFLVLGLPRRRLRLLEGVEPPDEVGAVAAIRRLAQSTELMWTPS